VNNNINSATSTATNTGRSIMGRRLAALGITLTLAGAACTSAKQIPQVLFDCNDPPSERTV